MSQPHATAEAAEHMVAAEIAALDVPDLAAVKSWIASGCEGTQPKPDVEVAGSTDVASVLKGGAK